MSSRAAANEQLERILYILPRAAGDGVAIADLAAELGITEEQLLGDLQSVTTRDFAKHPDRMTDIQVVLEPDRIEVWAGGEFERPVKLSLREALAATLGLRMIADGAGGKHEKRCLDLARWIDEKLAVAAAESIAAHYGVDHGDPSGGELLAVLRDAVHERRRCRLQYLKPTDPEPEDRVVCPYVLAYAGGRWYVIGESEKSAGPRVFRLDRIHALELDDATFEVPADFDHRWEMEGGFIYRADEEIDAVVRYSPKIARWFLERDEGEEQPDGSVIVTHGTADPDWLLRHLLQYGAEAELFEPPALRDLVTKRVSDMLVASTPA